jgi:copper(I)-binding protein
MALGLLGLSPLAAARADDMSLMASNAWSRPTASAAMAGVVYLTGLIQALSAGQTFPLTLSFANGTKVTTTVTVQSMTAPAPADTMGSMGGMKMSP